MRTLMLLTVAVGLASLVTSCSPVPPAPGETPMVEKQFMNLEYRSKPNGYTHVVTSPPGKMIFVSGQSGSSPDGGGERPADFAGQAENTFKNLENCLKMAGATFRDVVKINYFLSDINDLGTLREIRAKYLNMEAPPAATAVQAALFQGILLEVEVVAVVQE